MRLAVTLLSFSRRLSASGDKDRAHDTARQALQLLEQTANQPSAGAVEWNEYADALLKVEWPDLRQSARALQLFRMPSPLPIGNIRSSWTHWHRAWFRMGDATKAAETEREALRLLPANATGGLSAELSQALKTFTSGTPRTPQSNFDPFRRPSPQYLMAIATEDSEWLPFANRVDSHKARPPSSAVCIMPRTK